MVTLLVACDFRSSGPHVQCVIGTLPSLYSSIFRLRELQKPYTRESLVSILSSLLVVVNLLYCMVVVTVSSHGDIAAYHLDYQCVIASPFAVQTDSVFLLLGHLSFGLSLLTVVSLPDDLTVTSGGPVRRMMVVKKRRN